MLTKLRTVLRLGAINVLRVALYRLQLRSGWFAWQMPAGRPVPGPFFLDCRLDDETVRGQAGTLLLFDWKKVETAGPPDWFLNYVDRRAFAGNATHWSGIPDFGTSAGDIKTIWELSRFGWLVRDAWESKQSGESTFLLRMEAWLTDWSKKNPANIGPNWKCAQETSIRVLHLAYSCHLIGRLSKISPAVEQLIREHCRRVKPTMHYAIAQDNNHGTSEAAALFVAGAWFEIAGRNDGESSYWLSLGRRWLENRVARLLMDDGSFSQHSTVYHRMLLDTLVISETFRRMTNLPVFSEGFLRRASLASAWLRLLTDPQTGDVPNLGANDGTRLFPLPMTSYRDFRPTVQAASAMFEGGLAYGPGDYDGFRTSLNINSDGEVPPLKGRLFPRGGYALLRWNQGFSALLRLPQFQFRPSQADIHHVDIWYDGDNVVRDGGTFSYNCSVDRLDYFSGVASHSTVQFDDRQPMSRIGRFLFADWPRQGEKTKFSTTGRGCEVSSKFIDSHGACHVRTVNVLKDAVTVNDELSGSFERAVLRWRLRPDIWTLKDNKIVSSGYEITVSADADIELLLCEGEESRNYFRVSTLPVAEVHVSGKAKIQTRLMKLAG